MTKQKYVSIQVYPETKERFQQIEGPLGSSQNSIMEKLLDMWDGQNKPKEGNKVISVPPELYARIMVHKDERESMANVLERFLIYFEKHTAEKAVIGYRAVSKNVYPTPNMAQPARQTCIPASASRPLQSSGYQFQLLTALPERP